MARPVLAIRIPEASDRPDESGARSERVHRHTLMQQNFLAGAGSTMYVMNARKRSFAAILALIGLLFAQLAVAAYVCPMADGSGLNLGAPTQDGGCDGMPMDAVAPALCHAHSQQGDQSADRSPSPLPELSAAWPIDVIPGGLHQATAVVASGVRQAILTSATATAPPRSGHTCCLRL